MKIVRIFVFCFLIPGVASAQAWSAIAKAGPLWNSRSTRPVTNEHSSRLNAFGAVGAVHKVHDWEYGMMVGLYSFSFLLKGPFVFGPDPANGQYVTRYRERTTRLPGMCVMPFVNRCFDTGRLTWYVGAAPVYGLLINPELYEHANPEQHGVGVGKHAFGLELHGGFLYRLSTGCNVFAEPVFGALNMPALDGRRNMLFASLGLGVRINVR